jgi:hypothetical protein
MGDVVLWCQFCFNVNVRPAFILEICASFRKEIVKHGVKVRCMGMGHVD